MAFARNIRVSPRKLNLVAQQIRGQKVERVPPLFRRVWWHSVVGAGIIGLIALLQAYVFTGAIPTIPGK